ncbi:MAG: hypothetical protein QOK35_1667 [Pseudonocardiales bacterium]|nr:hypothetical protein [Pseudonocardiales bacterium]
MPAIEVVDSTWIAAPAATVAAIIAEPGNWRRWWPGLELEVTELRAVKGVRWAVPSVAGHPGLSGSAEVWLEPLAEGVVAHFFLRLDAAAGRVASRRSAERVAHEYRLRTKTAFWALADRLDPARMQRHVSAEHPAST